jgi:hypothetical protein
MVSQEEGDGYYEEEVSSVSYSCWRGSLVLDEEKRVAISCWC